MHAGFHNNEMFVTSSCASSHVAGLYLYMKKYMKKIPAVWCWNSTISMWLYWIVSGVDKLYTAIQSTFTCLCTERYVTCTWIQITFGYSIYTIEYIKLRRWWRTIAIRGTRRRPRARCRYVSLILWHDPPDSGCDRLLLLCIIYTVHQLTLSEYTL